MTNTYAVGAGWKGLLAEAGIQAEDVLRRARLPEDLLNRENVRLDTDAFFRFADALETSMPDAKVWVRLSDAMRPEYFSPAVFASLCSPNLAVAVERLALFKPLIGPVELQVHETSEGLDLAFRWREASVPVPAYLHVVEALFITKLARLGTHVDVSPTRVMVPELPRDPRPFEEYLGARVTQGDALVVSFSQEDAARPFMSTNGEMWAIFEPELRRRLADMEASATFTDRTQAVLLEAIPSGQVSMDQVANRLAVSSRTLHRRLREEGTSFKEVLRDTREKLARHYLGRTHTTSSEIAYLLGFDEPTSFFRAFRSWTGMSPESLRRRIIAERD